MGWSSLMVSHDTLSLVCNRGCLTHAWQFFITYCYREAQNQQSLYTAWLFYGNSTELPCAWPRHCNVVCLEQFLIRPCFNSKFWYTWCFHQTDLPFHYESTNKEVIAMKGFLCTYMREYTETCVLSHRCYETVLLLMCCWCRSNIL